MVSYQTVDRLLNAPMLQD